MNICIFWDNIYANTGDMTGDKRYVGVFCDRILVFCRDYSDPREMRNPKNGFGCGNCHPDNCGITIFVADGTDYRCMVGDYNYQR